MGGLSQYASRPSRARGLKLLFALGQHRQFFASITGAWIETCPASTLSCVKDSRPSRARGLKHLRDDNKDLAKFASITGAWIETTVSTASSGTSTVRVHHGRVD